MIHKSYIKVCLCVLLCFFFAAWRSLPLAAQTADPAAATTWTRTNPGGGATWTQVNEGMAWPHARSVAIDPKNPALVWAGSSGTGFQKRLFPDQPPTGNLIRNGDVSSGEEPWQGGVEPWTGHELQVRNREICLIGIPPGSEPAAAQIAQTGLALENGQRYAVDFDMWANTPANVTLILGTSQEPWVRYFAPTVPLGDLPRHYHFEFVMQHPTDPAALFAFHLGGQAAVATCLDNVVVQKISSTTPTPTPPVTPTATPLATVTATPTAPVVRQSPVEVIEPNATIGTADANAGNAWGGHQTRIVRTQDGLFTTYLVGNQPLASEWRLAQRQSNGGWRVLAQGVAGREPVNLLAAPDGTLYLIGYPDGLGTLWFGKPSNGTLTMQQSRLAHTATPDHWNYGAAGIDAAGNLCALSSDESYDDSDQHPLESFFNVTCYLAAQQRWVTQRLYHPSRYAYTYLFPQANGGLALVASRNANWVHTGYPDFSGRQEDSYNNAFRYWRTTDLATQPLQTFSYAHEEPTAACPDTRSDAEGDAYLDTQGRMHILYTRRALATGCQLTNHEHDTRFYHRVVAPDGTTLFDGEIQYGADRKVGWQARLWQDRQGRFYLLSGWVGNVYPLAADGVTLGTPVSLNLGSFGVGGKGFYITAPRTGSVPSDVVDVVFASADETKWLYFQLDFSAALPAPPSALAGTTVSSAQINLTWADNAANERGFHIERCQGANCTNFSPIFTTASNTRSYASTGLVADTTYCYRVRAYNDTGNSGYSNTACRTTGPLPPTSLTANRILATEANLFWVETTTNERGFKLQRCAGAACTNFVQIALLPANVIGYHDTGLMANTTYRYRVAAYTADGNSTYAAIRTITTAAVAATAVEAVALEEASETPLATIVAQPNTQAIISHAVTCYNQTPPAHVTLLVDTQTLPMMAEPATPGLYLATVAVTDEFSRARDYPLLVQWQCPGEAAPLTDYLGLLQVGSPLTAAPYNNQLYLPVIAVNQQ